MKYEVFNKKIGIEETDITFETIYNKPFIPKDYIEDIKKADILIIPECPFPEKEVMDVDAMVDELSVFYVAVTRARKQVYVSASAKRENGKQGCLSCFTRIPGIRIVNAER